MADSVPKSDLSGLLNIENECLYTDLADGKIDKISLTREDSISVLHLNIRGLIKNNDSLTLLLKDLQEKKVVPQFVCLCETFLSS